jgi:hypothetical protein
MKNTNPERMRYLGIALIVLGVFAALQLWFLLPVVILGSVGAYVYMERRREGRVVAAVQSALWLMGMALLFLVDFIFPGVLILAGVSLLLRGNEPGVDVRVSGLLSRFGVHLPQPGYTPATTSVPTATSNTPAPTSSTPAPTSSTSEEYTGKTTRL